MPTAEALNPARYERVGVLGRGATAETLLVKDRLRNNKLVAQKIFFEAWSQRRPELIEREFRTLSNLFHPSIACIEDFGRSGERYYLVSEYIEGRTLLEEFRSSDLNQVLWLTLQLLEALDYLYFRNVVHLDLKPQNVLVHRSPGQGMSVKLIDFGLAALLSEAPPQASTAIGTPPFTAPEFALRRGIDTRSDLYSVGILLYIGLSGRLPFAGADPIAILNQQLQRDPPPLKDLKGNLPLALSNYVARLIDRHPERRWKDPRSALAALLEAAGESFLPPRFSPIPIFEDPELVFRRSEFERLFEQVSANQGRWLFFGETGMGKSFTARWLQRRFWQQQVSAILARGSEILLETGAQGTIDETLWIIDDADQGPVLPWLRARPQLPCIALSQDQTWLKGEPGWQSHGLRPLDPTELHAALSATFHPVNPEIVKRWAERSEGIPGNLVSHARELVEAGLLKKEGLGWRLDFPGYLEGPPRPGTLDAKAKLRTILRLSRTSLDAQTLAACSGLAVTEVEETLQKWLIEGGIERELDTGRIQFRALDPLPMEVDRSLKGIAALTLLQGFYDRGRYRDGLEFMDQLFSGGDFAENDVGLMKARLLVGDGQYTEALQILTENFLQALDSRQRALAHEALGKAYLFSGSYDEARIQFRRALDDFVQDQDVDGCVRIQLHQGILAQRRGDFATAREQYEGALKRAEQARQSVLLRGVLILNLANLAYDSTDYEAAESGYRESLALLNQTQHGSATAQAYLNYATLSFYQGKPLQSEHHSREALKLAVLHRNVLTQGFALLLLAMIDGRRNQPERQLERLNEAVAVFEKPGFQFERVQALIHVAYFHAANGNLKQAELAAGLAFQLSSQIKAPDLAAQSRLILGKISARQGHWKTAEDQLKEAHRHFQAGKNLQLQWECEFERGELERLKSNPQAARDFYQRALKSIERLLDTMPPLLRESFLRDRKRERVEEAIHGLEGEMR